jgi:protein SCO1/2
VRAVSGSRSRILLAAAVALAGAGCGGTSTAPSDRFATVAAEASAIHGGVLTPPNDEPRLVLTDTAGSAYDVERRNPGNVTLEYFGYTHCPDVCPTTMADIAQALRRSSAVVRAKVTVVFVTVDPHRDSRSVLRRWLDDFSPSFVGLRGSLAQVTRAQRNAGLPVSKVSVEHSPEVIAYTPDRLAHVIYVDGPSTVEDLVHDLPILTTGPGFGA